MMFTDEVRQAVRDSGLTHYRIRKDTGLDRGQFSRFMAGKAFLWSANLNKLAAYLDMHVVRGQRKRKGK